MTLSRSGTISSARNELDRGRHRVVRAMQSASVEGHEMAGSTRKLSAVTSGPAFIDVTSQALGGPESYTEPDASRGSITGELCWMARCGIDVYGNNGVAAGDFDNDGFDDLYVCQPAGLPNRLYRNRGDGTFEDVTEKAGVGVLDNTACALFADFRKQRTAGSSCGLRHRPSPVSQSRRRHLRDQARCIQFCAVRPREHSRMQLSPTTTVTVAWISTSACTCYYLGLDQYHYPIPYFDARNGPPNCLLHNEGNAAFVDRTKRQG